MNIVFIQEFHPNIGDSFVGLEKKHKTQLLYNKKYIRQKQVVSKRIRRSKILGQAIYNLKDISKELEKKPDLVVVKSFESLNSYLVALLCKLKGIPICFQVQRVKIKSKCMRIILSLVLSKKTIFYSVTKEGYDYLRTSFKNVSYIPACIDSKKFLSHSAKKQNKLKIICVSKFQKRKKLELLFQVMKSLKQDGESVSLSLVAMTSPYYKKEQERTVSMINEYGLKDDVSIILNASYDEMLTLYAAHDLFVFPAVSEPLGYSLLEAMASGLPVIASKEVGASCYIEQGRNGLIFDASDPQNLHKAINEFYVKNKLDRKKLLRYGVRSTQIVEENHEPTIFLENFEKHILNKL